MNTEGHLSNRGGSVSANQSRHEQKQTLRSSLHVMCQMQLEKFLTM